MTKAITTDAIPNWTTRKREAIDKLDQLRRDRGIALLDGKPFDDRSIAQAEAELDAVDAAEVEQERRHREAQTAAFEAHQVSLRAEMVAVLNRRSKVIIEAELAAVRLAAALETILTTSKDACRLALALGHKPPMSLSAAEVRLRAGFRLANILVPAVGPKLGRISFPPIGGENLPDGTKLSVNWHDSDAEKIGYEISRILNLKEAAE